MQFSVGYQLRRDNGYLDSIIRNKDRITEVYFSFGDFANGRNKSTQQQEMTPWQAQAVQLEQLEYLCDAGLHFNLLFNATCYGEQSQSRAFFDSVGQCVEFVADHYILNGITTTSPLIARFVKDNFPLLDVRASVNMSIGTVEGMEYVADVFDSFYVKRELNRSLNAIAALKTWCDDKGKKLYLLANSGCLNHCSAHVFHDNLVSHEAQIARMDNGYAFEGICRKYLAKPENVQAFFDNTNYIRPEDIHYYEGLVSAVKLATRVNQNPERILRAYVEQERYLGSTLDLLEPSHTALLYPRLLENANIKSSLTNGCLSYGKVTDALVEL